MRRAGAATAVVVLVCVLRGLAHQAPADAAVVRQGAAPMIRATPNPASPDSGTTEIDWDTGDESPGIVLVIEDRGEPVLLAEGAHGPTTVDWIRSNHTYQFDLYRQSAPSVRIASVLVTRPIRVTRVIPITRPSAAMRLAVVGVLVLLAFALWLFLREPRDARPAS